jgi:hypothetical protein
VAARTNAVVAVTEATPRHGMTLDAVEAYLTGDKWTFTKGALDDVLELQHDVAEGETPGEPGDDRRRAVPRGRR